MTKTLSEKLLHDRENGLDHIGDDDIAQARSLEERVTELQGLQDRHAFYADYVAATERAASAEAKLKWIEETQRTFYDVEARAAAAEAEVVRLRARGTPFIDHGQAFNALADERDAALERAASMEKEAARLHDELRTATEAGNIAANCYVETCKERDALRAKLKKVRAELLKNRGKGKIPAFRESAILAILDESGA